MRLEEFAYLCLSCLQGLRGVKELQQCGAQIVGDLFRIEQFFFDFSSDLFTKLGFISGNETLFPVSERQNGKRMGKRWPKRLEEHFQRDEVRQVSDGGRQKDAQDEFQSLQKERIQSFAASGKDHCGKKNEERQETQRGTEKL